MQRRQFQKAVKANTLDMRRTIRPLQLAAMPTPDTTIPA